MINEERLLKKGWTNTEILHTKKILESAEEKKKKHILFLDSILFWLMLVVLGIVYLGFAFVIRVLAIFLEPVYLNLISLLLGFIIGIFITSSIENIHWFKIKHHILAIVIKPLLAILSFFIVFVNTRFLIEEKGIISRENLLIAAIFFILGSLAPYLFHFVKWSKKKR